MRLVIDTNILITAFWKSAVFYEIIKVANPQLISPAFAIEEIISHKEEICKKARINNEEFENTLRNLHKLCTVVPLIEYASQLPAAALLFEKNHPQYHELLDDIDFLALALHVNTPLWTNDRLLALQTKVDILTTKQMILLIK